MLLLAPQNKLIGDDGLTFRSRLPPNAPLVGFYDLPHHQNGGDGDLQALPRSRGYHQSEQSWLS